MSLNFISQFAELNVSLCKQDYVLKACFGLLPGLQKNVKNESKITIFFQIDANLACLECVFQK